MNELHGNASHMNGGCLGVREDNFYDNEVSAVNQIKILSLLIFMYLIYIIF